MDEALDDDGHRGWGGVEVHLAAVEEGLCAEEGGPDGPDGGFEGGATDDAQARELLPREGLALVVLARRAGANGQGGVWVVGGEPAPAVVEGLEEGRGEGDLLELGLEGGGLGEAA